MPSAQVQACGPTQGTFRGQFSHDHLLQFYFSTELLSGSHDSEVLLGLLRQLLMRLSMRKVHGCMIPLGGHSEFHTIRNE